MKSVHLVIPDLFLPQDIAVGVCADLRLPAMEKLLARGAVMQLADPTTKPLVLSAIEGSGRMDSVAGSGASTGSARTGGLGITLENHLCELFGVTSSGDAPVASISAAFDGLQEGFWLRADPVHLRLQRDQMLLIPNVDISADEAKQVCASLNEHFTGQGMEFVASHPLRWYVRFDHAPDIETVPISQAYGRNVHGLLPRGSAGARWHKLRNEIQMLLHAHPLNEARESRGALAINSLWLWGGGELMSKLEKNYDCASSDEILVEMLAAATDTPFTAWPERWNEDSGEGKQLLVWIGLRSALQRGDLAAWRDSLQEFETNYAQPLWQALRSGRITQIQLDIPSADRTRRVLLNRSDTFAFWRRIRRMVEYTLV